LVAEAAVETGLDDQAVQRLESAWDDLAPWPEAASALQALVGRVKLGVVTNCSIELGRRAAKRLDIDWDVVITSEEAGFYKPDPAPYRLAMQRLGVDAARTRFVAGSGYDLFGTEACGLLAYWHNRIGLARPDGAPAPDFQSPTLDAMPEWALRSTSP
jgi:2-haloalkanoic acid dehalogenase type II